MIDLYIRKYIEKFLYSLLILGGITWLFIGLFKFNIITWLSKKTFKSIDIFIYLLIGIAALYFILSRDFYLPFLGETVFPCEPLPEKIPDNADLRTTIKVEPNSNVIFWASESSTEDIVDNPWSAYVNYKNSGITRSDDDGTVDLRVRTPTSYKVPTGRILKPHIHYRVCKKNGFLGRVETTYV